ncbi:MAG: hypothetical protein M0Q42_00150 [Xanthomonadales bacterium]|nr:hypothetical protein [Xanthomonadales bacterium]
MDELSLGARIIYVGREGTIQWLGDQQVGISLDDGEKVLVRRDALAAQEPDGFGEPGPSSGNQPGPLPFALHEPAGEESHSMGSHWRPFFDDLSESVLQQLPAILPNARLHGGYSGFFKPQAPAPALGPHGVILFSGSDVLPTEAGHLDFSEMDQRQINHTAAQNGLACVVWANPDSGSNELTTLFPMSLHGCQHRLTLHRIHVWESGLEAQIEAAIGEARITFFDTDFVCNQGWYADSVQHEFLLTGIAYEAAPAQSREFTLQRDEAYFDAMQWLTGEDLRPDDGSLTQRFVLDGMASLLPIEQWDRDDYEFVGPIMEVRREVMLGQPIWRLRVTVFRLDEVDVDLDVIVSGKAWRGEQPPQVGQNVQGSLWLQGRMWMSGDR